MGADKHDRHIVLIYPQKNTLLLGIPLGIAYIGAALRESRYPVSIVDMRYQDEKKLFSKLDELRPDIVGFYASSEIAPYVISLGARIKHGLKDVILVVGGPHATIDPDFFLKYCFDIVVKGEGEATIKEVVGAVRHKNDLAAVRGISYKSNGEIFSNPPAEFIEDLDSLPFPAFDLFPDMENTLGRTLTWANLNPFTHILVSRGCPYQCTFCQPTLSRIFGKRIRRLSPRRVVELLSYLKQKYHIREVFFEDDLLLSRAWKDWLFELTDLMIKQGLGLRWWGQGRADTVDRDILIQAKKAGCYMVMCGVESGSQKTLDFYNKGITPDKIRSFFKLCGGLGLMSIAEIIFGAPEESPKDAMDTVNLMREIQPDIVWVSILTPYPGTYLSDWLVTHNVSFEADLTRLDRSIQKRRIDSEMTEQQIFNARAKIFQPHVVLKKLLLKKYYRDAYLAKVNSLILDKKYPGLFKFLLWTLLRPVISSLQLIYLKYSDSAVIKPLKKIYNRLNPV